MKYSLYFVILALSVVVTACGPSVPGPAQPTRGIKTVATPTAAQIAQVVQTPTAVQPPSAPSVTSTSSRECNTPDSWSPYIVKPGDTLFSLAKQVNFTPEELMRSNCLASSLIGVGDTLYLPMERCTPSQPEGWRIYVVRNGDTLFSLATTRDTTVSEVKQVNCLVSDSLEVGQQLFLPPLKIVPLSTTQVGAPPPPPPPPPTPCSVFSCRDGDPSTLDVPVGGPDDPTFIPCELPRPKPWVDTPAPFITELGLRRYFYACDFLTDPVSATVKFSDGSIREVGLSNAIPNPDLLCGRAQAVVDWPALPTQPTGIYTLTITDGNGNQESKPFVIITPTQEYILPVPASGSPGETLQVYYVNFALNSTPTFDFYGEDQKVVGQPHKHYHRTRWQILIDQPLGGMSEKGWAQSPLESLPTDQPTAYAISYDNKRVLNLIWLNEAARQLCQYPK